MNAISEACTKGVVTVHRAAARRGKVIETARILFADNGFHATGIAQIAKQSGIAVGQIYRDFACKEDIVAEIVEIDCAAFMEGDPLNDAIARGDIESVRAWVHYFVDPQKSDDSGQLFAEIVAESSRNDRIAAIFARVQAAARANLLSAIGAFAPGPAMAPRREVLADMIMTLSLGLLMHRLMRTDIDLGRLLAALSRAVDRGLDDLRTSHAGVALSS